MNKSLEETSRAILETLMLHLDAFGGIIFFPDEENNNLIVHSYTDRRLINKVVGLVPFNVYNVKYPLSSKHLLLAKCIHDNKIVSSQKLSDFLHPAFKSKSLLNIIQKIIRVKLCIGIPIIIPNNHTGILFISFKKGKLSKRDNELIEFYANLSSIAILHNHRIESLETQYESEKETTSILSHEIKTPIAIAQNSTHMISLIVNKHQYQMPPNIFKDLQHRLSDMNLSIKRMTDISNSIFNLREVETHVPEDVHQLDLPRQLDAVVDTYKIFAQQKGLNLTHEFPTAKSKYFAGIIQLEQIITILLDNAIKYTRKGSINLKIQYMNDQLQTIVTDSGIGIPKNQRQVIFNRFYRYKDKKHSKITRGLGLGLYIAKKITLQLKGSITAQNNPAGHGTQFIVTIPLHSKALEKTE